MAARQQIPYGIVDFKRIRDEGYYYVDKTAYIRKMEARDSFVFFVRPRRMGKSLFSDVANFRSLFHYYGILSMAGRRKGMTFFKVPNVCVERQLFAYLREAYRRTRQPDWYAWQRLASEFAYDGAWRPFLERLAADFADTTPVRGGIQGEARIQGYMQAEFGHLKFFLMAPEMETARGFCDFALFPERVHYGDAAHSYLIELKYAAKDAADAVLDAQCAEAKAQLARYRADRFVPALARGTTLHQIVFQFKGAALHRLEQISEEAL